MKKILCPVNFTDTALNALEYASNVAHLHEGVLSLLHVITDEEYNKLLEDKEDENIRTILDEFEDQLKRKLSALSVEVESSYPNLKCDFTLAYGNLVEAIIKVAREGDYKLIVMGNDGVIDASEAFRGSSIVKVLQEASCAVLSVPKQADFTGFNKVIFGTEFRKTDREALHQLYIFMKAAGGSIKVVHLTKESDEEELTVSRKKMDDLKTYLNYPKIHYEIKSYTESVHLGLSDYLEEEKGDLLVLVTHQRNLLERIFQKSLSKRMSYFADYPILIFLDENL